MSASELRQGGWGISKNAETTDTDTGEPLGFFSLTLDAFLGSMLPQYMALSISFVSQLVSSKRNLGHFEARYEVEL